MARVVRKVSGKAVRGQKKGLLYSSKFWISVGAAVVAIIAITLGLVFGLRGNNGSAVKVDDYFGRDNLTVLVDGKNEDVKFTKASYSEVKMHTNVNLPEDVHEEMYIDYAFVFATDLSVFYPETLMQGDKDLKNNAHESVFNALKLLQHSIDLYNKNTGNEDRYKVALYIVDTKDTQGSVNNKILSDELFGGNAEGSNKNLLTLVHGGERITEFKLEGNDRTFKLQPNIGTSLLANEVESFVNTSFKFIEANFKDVKDEK